MTSKILLDVQMASSLPTPEVDQFQLWAQLAGEDVLKQQSEDQELTIRIVDEREIQSLNHTYRNQNKPTNVLSFPYEQAPGMHVPLLGDLVVCVPIVLQEAKEQGKPIDSHWAHLVIHGVLHLLGYDHIQDEEAEKMEQLEVTLMAKLGYANPYL
ncbi:MAG: rRNA maturation RNase YbeY [Pseudomonadales bacterium]|nr:rRNA maturation RNase YbeY [Pseudomonadales bacterium]